MEIERKFRLAALPEGIDLGPGVPIEQGYLFTDPAELRLRRQGDRLSMTVKTSGAEVREEWDCEIPEWVWRVLWPRVGSAQVMKTRHVVELGGHKLEVDIYHGELDGLITLECEFSSQDEARSFSLPAEFSGAVEVTQDERYKNKALAAHGLPSENGD